MSSLFCTGFLSLSWKLRCLHRARISIGLRDSSYFPWGTSFPIFFFSWAPCHSLLFHLPYPQIMAKLPQKITVMIPVKYCGVQQLPPLSCTQLKGCVHAHFVCVHAQSLSGVWLFATPWTVAYQAPSVHRVSQARILEWAAISISRGSSQSRDWTCVSCIGRGILDHWATWEALKAIVGQQQLYQWVSSTRALSSHLFGSPQCWRCQKLNIFLFLLVSHLDSLFWPHLSIMPTAAAAV